MSWIFKFKIFLHHIFSESKYFKYSTLIVTRFSTRVQTLCGRCNGINVWLKKYISRKESIIIIFKICDYLLHLNSKLFSGFQNEFSFIETLKPLKLILDDIFFLNSFVFTIAILQRLLSDESESLIK